MNAFHSRDEAALARRVLAALRLGPLDRQTIKARLGLLPRSRKVNGVISDLIDAGLVRWTAAGYAVDRAPRPGELDVPRRELEVLTDAVEAGAGLEVRAIRFEDSDDVRLQARRVSRFPSGGVRAMHVLGVTPEVARYLAEALLEVADEF